MGFRLVFYKLFFVFLVVSCAHDDKPVEDFEPHFGEPVSPDEIDEVIDFVDPTHWGVSASHMPPLLQGAKREEGLPAYEEEPEEPSESSISLTEGYPAGMEGKIQYWIKYFTERHPRTMSRYLSRGSKYRGLISKVLREQGLPQDLFYVALIESGFSLKATSSASASGPWQFMKATGKRYGLTINYYVDERWDPVRSTIAASLYLSDLNNVFHSWYLAMAAYNAGEMRIMGAIMRANSRDFWQLVQKKKLPRETMNYIPKFIAAAKIGKNPERYGIKFTESSEHVSASVQVPSPMSLRTMAKITGVSYNTLKRLNPHIKRGITPPNSGRTYKLWVPEDATEVFEEKRALLAKNRLRFKNKLAKSREDLPRSGYHKVRRGETLDLISRKYGMTLSQLRRVSGLRGSRIFPGQRIKVVKNAAKASRGKPTYQRYRVRKGDNLYTIARRFDTTIREIRKMNKIRRNRIYAGQLLRVKKNRS